ncbi:MAG: putative sulfate exporter family transporter [Rhodocyclaceae bacterium]|nr:putative sulfate exporter family transporter [Rhodocyclaceae bacterium]MBP6108771.1 putative sulfate exporter family transporter [Rhodocyclaceae bacterium]
MTSPAPTLLIDRVTKLWQGLLISCVVAIAASFIAQTRGGPNMLYALLIGMALNSITVGSSAQCGVNFAAKQVLRLGVTLLGARITLEQIGTLGWHSGAIVIGGVIVTLAFSIFAAKVLNLERRIGILTGGATAICGASAAIAIAAVLPPSEKLERELVFTIAGVTVLSTLAMIVYPMLVKLFELDGHQAGIFLGGTIHDVAQVVGAGYSVSTEVGDYALLTKMARVAMLLPVVVATSLVVRHLTRERKVSHSEPLVPAFLLGFAALVTVGSMGWIPREAISAVNEISRSCLLVAIAAVGLKTSLLDVREVGSRAMLLLCSEAIFLVGFMLLAQKLG